MALKNLKKLVRFRTENRLPYLLIGPSFWQFKIFDLVFNSNIKIRILITVIHTFSTIVGPQEVFPDLILEAITSGKDLEKFKQKLIEAQTAKPKEETEKSEPTSKETEEGLVLVRQKYLQFAISNNCLYFISFSFVV